MNKDKDDASTSTNIDETMRLLIDNDAPDPAETEELGEESDIASHDEVEERDGGSESEQDDDELLSDDEDPDTSTQLHLARNKVTKWNKKPPSKKRRASYQNIITRLPGVKGIAKKMLKQLLIIGVTYFLIVFLK